MLPLHHTPKERHIKFLLCSICNIGTRLWRQMLYQLSYTPTKILLSYYKGFFAFCQGVFEKFFFLEKDLLICKKVIDLYPKRVYN